MKTYSEDYKVINSLLKPSAEVLSPSVPNRYIYNTVDIWMEYTDINELIDKGYIGIAVSFHDIDPIKHFCRNKANSENYQFINNKDEGLVFIPVPDTDDETFVKINVVAIYKQNDDLITFSEKLTKNVKYEQLRG